MRTFPKLKYPNDPETDGVLAGEIVVTEKLDGANFRFTWDDDGELIVGTRNHEYHHDDENIPKAFEHAVEYVKDRESDLWGYDDLTLFGEAMHLHSLQYDDVDYVNPSSGSPYFADEPNVVLFDAWQNGEWLGWDDFRDLIAPTRFEATRVIARGDGEWAKENGALEIPDESMFGGQPEGIVVRRTDGSVRAKKVSNDFKEKNAVAFGDPSKAASDAGSFVASYVTDARIEKEAHKLVDRGEYENLEMAMMQDLPRNVLKDAVAENGWELLTSGGFEAEWDDDFKAEVRSKASKKCARVLKTLCQEF
jgi:hypothetical protein